ncbi:hypothetical protein BKA65DRAFT_560033 [Rhexocercosporidium sp. MPI-PUGE-AT-0058]|nr:hypothetical protein BKA65DRAFT_560033 [Rhexocercosporidium sp. MPI-PUGE-AT-0058]
MPKILKEWEQNINQMENHRVWSIANESRFQDHDLLFNFMYDEIVVVQRDVASFKELWSLEGLSAEKQGDEETFFNSITQNTSNLHSNTTVHNAMTILNARGSSQEDADTLELLGGIKERMEEQHPENTDSQNPSSSEDTWLIFFLLVRERLEQTSAEGTAKDLINEQIKPNAFAPLDSREVMGLRAVLYMDLMRLWIVYEQITLLSLGKPAA